jgi:S1-C subfamily serine protease
MRFLLTLALLFSTPAHAWLAPVAVRSSVVRIETPNGRGTGFHIKAPSGALFILTNGHVCKLYQPDKTIARDEGGGEHVVKPLYIDTIEDLCLMTPMEGGAPLPFGSMPEYQQKIQIYGHPMGGDFSFSEGFVLSRVDDEFLSNAQIEPGSSGSPVLSGDKVVGIIVALNTKNYNSFFISVDAIKAFISSY